MSEDKIRKIAILREPDISLPSDRPDLIEKGAQAVTQGNLDPTKPPDLETPAQADSGEVAGA